MKPALIALFAVLAAPGAAAAPPSLEAETARAEAIALGNAGKWEAALRAIEEALRKAPDWPDAIFVRAGVHAHLAGEKSTLEGLKKIAPDFDFAGVRRSLEAAARDLERYLRAKPEAENRAVAVATLGELRARLRVLGEAEKATQVPGGPLPLSGTLAAGPVPGADVPVLGALDHALAAENGDSPEAVAAAWRALASLVGQNPYRDEAQRRATRLEAMAKDAAAEQPRIERTVALASFTAAQRRAYHQKLLERFGGLAVYRRWLEKSFAPKCPPGMVAFAGSEQIEPFCLDVTEVTTTEALRCKLYAGDQPPANFSGRNRHAQHLPFAIHPGREKHPANTVSRAEADDCCRTLGKRLPTKAEWLHAAGAPFPWGAAPFSASRVCAGRSAQQGTCAVGELPAGATPRGVLDLFGNVEEWVVEGWLLGGSWRLAKEPTAWARVPESDMRNNPQHQNAAFGFRCASTP